MVYSCSEGSLHKKSTWSTQLSRVCFVATSGILKMGNTGLATLSDRFPSFLGYANSFAFKDRNIKLLDKDYEKHRIQRLYIKSLDPTLAWAPPKFAVLTILRALEVGLMFRAYHHVFYCCHYNRSFITPRAIELKMWIPKFELTGSIYLTLKTLMTQPKRSTDFFFLLTTVYWETDATCSIPRIW